MAAAAAAAEEGWGGGIEVIVSEKWEKKEGAGLKRCSRWRKGEIWVEERGRGLVFQHAHAHTHTHWHAVAQREVIKCLMCV